MENPCWYIVQKLNMYVFIILQKIKFTESIFASAVAVYMDVSASICICLLLFLNTKCNSLCRRRRLDRYILPYCCICIVKYCKQQGQRTSIGWEGGGSTLPKNLFPPSVCISNHRSKRFSRKCRQLWSRIKNLKMKSFQYIININP